MIKQTRQVLKGRGLTTQAATNRDPQPGSPPAIRLNNHLFPELNSNPNPSLSGPVGVGTKLDAVNSRLGEISVNRDTEDTDPDCDGDADCEMNSITLS